MNIPDRQPATPADAPQSLPNWVERLRSRLPKDSRRRRLYDRIAWPLEPRDYFSEGEYELTEALTPGAGTDEEKLKRADELLSEAQAIYASAWANAESAERRATTLQGAVAVATSLLVAGSALALHVGARQLQTARRRLACSLRGPTRRNDHRADDGRRSRSERDVNHPYLPLPDANRRRSPHTSAARAGASSAGRRNAGRLQLQREDCRVEGRLSSSRSVVVPHCARSARVSSVLARGVLGRWPDSQQGCGVNLDSHTYGQPDVLTRRNTKRDSYFKRDGHSDALAVTEEPRLTEWTRQSSDIV